MRVLAFADTHAPKHVSLLAESLGRLRLEGVELVLVAGDVVARGEWAACRQVEAVLRRFLPGVPAYGTFGNEDFEEVRGRIREECTEVVWLEDEAVDVEVGGTRVRIVGTPGVLDRPTRWQERNVPGIRGVYEARLERVRELLSHPSGSLKILVTHYPPRCGTLRGEDPRFWEEMSSARLAGVVAGSGVDLVVHGHLHRSVVHRDYIGSTPVYNVSLPAVKSAVIIEVRRAGLGAFLGP
ncbi:metallophosphoesterase family protein [Thermofilum pendens]|uniref:Metallophosphoesterase n=1 Tax=Thermofilum pendens (strain DSM 2475 / Hrk 5) TaxID=368408 RepID=A1RY62_THEPD|nr:metallophosphoesterase [Thermofilum pendens]ABL78142.1 metallophosphoesterase [Thermofilum pendens Hrk 5]